MNAIKQRAVGGGGGEGKLFAVKSAGAALCGRSTVGSVPGIKSIFVAISKKKRSPAFAVSQHAPALSADMGKAGSSGPAVLQAPSRSYKSRLCCEPRPGRRSENPSGFMTEPTRRQRRSVSTCAGASTLGWLPQRKPVCVIFVRSPHARLQLPWRCCNGVKTGRLTSGCGSGVVLIWNLLLIPSSPGPTNITSSPS